MSKFVKKISAFGSDEPTTTAKKKVEKEAANQPALKLHDFTLLAVDIAQLKSALTRN